MSRTHRRRPRALCDEWLDPQEHPAQEEKFAALVRDSARLSGRCMCGAEGELVETKPGYFEYAFSHARRCPALHGGKPTW